MSVRLFAPGLPAAGGTCVLSDEAARHARVLRLGPGDAVELFDGEGRRASGRVAVTAPRLVVEVGPPVAVPEPLPRVHLVLGMPKAGALDDAVRGATEAGASSVHLVLSGHSVGRRGDGRLDRLERIVREASRQCERDHRPAVHVPVELGALLARVPATDLRLVASARGAGAWPGSSGEEVWVAVGPEGGFPAAEEEALMRAGFAPVSLGPYVLRAVTAAPVAVALARFGVGAFPK